MSNEKASGQERFANRTKRKGQVATEFMLYISVFMFMTIAAFVIVNDLQNTDIPFEQNILARDTGGNFVSIMTLAVKGGEGFSYNYTFPRSLYSIPYQIDLSRTRQNDTILISWPGSYGNFSYQYDVPAFNYATDGSCLGTDIDTAMITSDHCSNVLMFYNDGNKVTITQLQ